VLQITVYTIYGFYEARELGNLILVISETRTKHTYELFSERGYEDRLEI